MTHKRTFYLFDEPSFFSGMSRVMDIGGTFNSYNNSKTPEEADIRALQLDWLCVGDDLVYAINKGKESK